MLLKLPPLAAIAPNIPRPIIPAPPGIPGIPDNPGIDNAGNPDVEPLLVSPKLGIPGKEPGIEDPGIPIENIDKPDPPLGASGPLEPAPLLAYAVRLARGLFCRDWASAIANAHARKIIYFILTLTRSSQSLVLLLF